MKKIILFTLAIAAVLSAGSCARKVTRVDPSEQIDVSGRWNNTDSRLTAEALTEDILTADWLYNHRDETGDKPVAIVDVIANKSHEHIDAETFAKDIERSFISSGKVRLVQGGEKREAVRAERADQQENATLSTMKDWGMEVGADYMLQGSINSIVDSHKRRKVVYYQVNLELTDIETSEVVWIGEKKISKYVKN